MKPGSHYYILNFHGLGEPAKPLDPGEDEVWLPTREFEEILDAVRERQDIHLTFDDGNISDARIALPALRARGMTAEFFISTGKIGQPGYLDAADIRSLADAGMTIGSHGVEHRSWQGLSVEALRSELEDSRQHLEDMLQRTIDRAALPFGRYERRVMDGLRRAGYARVYTSDGGPARKHAWLQPRNSFGPGDGPERVTRLTTASWWSPRAFARRLKIEVKKRR